MKQLFLASFSLLLALLVNEPGKVFAQARLAFPASYPGVSESKLAVSEKLLQEFSESFPDAERINWQESNNRYIVSFVEQGILNRITYKKNGDFISSFRNYGEHDLPYYLVNSLKKKYPGQKIFGVTEITTISDITYFVKLEGPKYWITVSLNSESDWFVVESYRKTRH